LVAVISSPDYLNDIEGALAKLGKEIAYKRIDREIDILSEVEKINDMSIDYLILDISCLEDYRRLPQAIRKVTLVNEKIHFFIIATEKFSGNEVVTNLISMGIYDIIGLKENENKNIPIKLIEHFENPSTYAKALKWDEGFERKKEKEKKFIETGRGRFGRNDDNQLKTIERDKIIGTVVIAVVGTMQRIGTTHTAISIAKYLMDNRHGVAVVELHNSNAFEYIKKSYDNVVEKKGMFSLAGIDFYPFDPTLAVSDLTLDDYSYIILDMGTYTKCNIAEFRRAQERIVVSGVKDWELENLEELIDCEEKNFKNKYYFTFSDDATFEFIKSSMDVLLSFKSPYNPQPFEVSDECTEVFGDMLKNVLPQIRHSKKNEGFIKYLLKKKEVKLYHKPVLVDKINLKNLQKKKKKDVGLKKIVGMFEPLIPVVIVLLILALLYYLFTQSNVFLYIKDLIDKL
jgi:hypothetical protein